MANIMRMGAAPGYLGSWDLEDAPRRELVLTIAKIVDEEVVGNDGRKELCTVFYWQEKEFLPMIVNLTNKKTLCKLYKTTDTEKLIGKRIIVGSESVRAFGGIYDALRFRDRVPPAKSTEKAICEECRGELRPRGNMSAAQLGAYTKKNYGKSLCSECATKAAQARAEAAQPEQEGGEAQ